MSNPFVAEIRIFAGNFAPKGWALCNGQIMPISQNTALFSLLGTTYGGDGKSTFALPNMQGSSPMQPGQGPGPTDRVLGEIGGEQNVTVIQTEIPAHSHGMQARPVVANVFAPDPTTALAKPDPATNLAYTGALGSGSVQLNPFSTSIVGSS